MKEIEFKRKNFLLPILSLVIISITIIASINSYITVSIFKTYMEEHIEQTKEEYTQKHKNRVYEEVHFVNDSIKFEITKIENRVKDSLKEKIQIALEITMFTYNTYKNTHNKEEIKKKISEALSAIKFNQSRSYYFMYDNKTKVIFGHPMKKFIDKDMTTFKDVRGRSLMETDSEILKNEKIGFNKIYFNKPNNQKEEFPKITCISKFEPLDLIIGIGEYLDVIEQQTKDYVLSRFSQIKYNEKDKYLVILDVHNKNGGDEFATVLLNSNRTELVGKKVSDNDEDIKGNKFRKDFLNLVVEKGEGYSTYWYKKPSTNSPKMKISYFLLQKDWNWIIASGFYYEDLEKQIAIMENSIDSYTSHIINKTLRWVGLLSFFSILIAIFVSFKIDQTIKKYTNTIIEYENSKKDQEILLIQQSKMAAMGEMIGNIAHQWRQPLSTISTASTGTKLQKEMNCLSDEQLLSALTAINDSAQYLSSTIEDFRGFFSPSNSKISKFYILDTFKKTFNLLNAQFNSKDIKFIKNIKNFELVSIENELIQVLVNILNNARDALIEKQSNKRLIFINTYEKNTTSYIEIIDNAGGIPKDIIHRIFEPYFTTKHKAQGTGIGLYMSEEIVEKHLKGKLLVSNETYTYNQIEYSGAKFTIKIPNNSI